MTWNRLWWYALWSFIHECLYVLAMTWHDFSAMKQNNGRKTVVLCWCVMRTLSMFQTTEMWNAWTVTSSSVGSILWHLIFRVNFHKSKPIHLRHQVNVFCLSARTSMADINGTRSLGPPTNSSSTWQDETVRGIQITATLLIFLVRNPSRLWRLYTSIAYRSGNTDKVAS